MSSYNTKNNNITTQSANVIQISHKLQMDRAKLRMTNTAEAKVKMWHYERCGC